MKTRFIKNRAVSEIGMGCMGMSHAAGAPMTIEDGAKVIRAAYEMGYTFFDTAKNYGYSGDLNHNEKILAKALSDVRDKVFIASKCGVDFDYAVDPDRPPLLFDSSRKGIRASVEGSLKRLNTDYIDLYFQARIDPKIEPEEVADTMSELIREGKILSWGVSEAPYAYIERAHAVCPLAAVENNYSIVNRRHEAAIPMLERLGIAWIAHGPLVKGLLSGAYQKGAVYSRDDWRSRALSDENIDRYQKLLDYLFMLSQEKSATPAQISIAWILHQKPYIIPIPGMRSIVRLEENAKSADVALTAEEIDMLNAITGEIQKDL